MSVSNPNPNVNDDDNGSLAHKFQERLSGDSRIQENLLAAVRLGLSPGPHCGSLQCSLSPLASGEEASSPFLKHHPGMGLYLASAFPASALTWNLRLGPSSTRPLPTRQCGSSYTCVWRCNQPVEWRSEIMCTLCASVAGILNTCCERNVRI